MSFKISEVEFIFKRELIITKSVCIKWACWSRAAGRGVRQTANEAEETREHRVREEAQRGSRAAVTQPAPDRTTLRDCGQIHPGLPDCLSHVQRGRGLPHSHQSANCTTEKQEKKEQSAIFAAFASLWRLVLRNSKWITQLKTFKAIFTSEFV